VQFFLTLKLSACIPPMITLAATRFGRICLFPSLQNFVATERTALLRSDSPKNRLHLFADQPQYQIVMIEIV